MKLYKVKKGDSTLNLKFTVEGYPILDENWKCKNELVKDITSNASPIFSKFMGRRSDLSAFDVHLTPAETEDGNIEEGRTYYWQVTIENPTMTPPYKKTITNKLEIEYKA
jgi:hypothetical protein